MTGAVALYLYAIAVGFVSAGIIGSAWALATGERPGFRLLLEPSFFAPFRALVVVCYAPLTVLIVGCWKLLANPPIGIVFIAASLGWSFLQGVFILTQVFNMQ